MSLPPPLSPKLESRATKVASGWDALVVAYDVTMPSLTVSRSAFACSLTTLLLVLLTTGAGRVARGIGDQRRLHLLSGMPDRQVPGRSQLDAVHSVPSR